MPHLSKHKLDYKSELEIKKTLELVFSNVKGKENVHSLFSSLLTTTERLMIAKRLSAVILLKEGVSESQVASSLHITRATVDKLNLIHQTNGQGYEIAVEILRKEKAYEEVKKALLSLVKYSIRASGGYVKPTIV